MGYISTFVVFEAGDSISLKLTLNRTHAHTKCKVSYPSLPVEDQEDHFQPQCFAGTGIGLLGSLRYVFASYVATASSYSSFQD